MAPRQYRSRIHLLAAREAPTIAVLQRKRAKLFHVIAIDTQTLRITEGSWFRGKLYAMRCDVSFDGKFMVYLAMGANGKTWNGVCRLPRLTTLIDAENTGAWNGGGYFAGRRVLKTNNWGTAYERVSNFGKLPFRLEAYKSRYGGEDLGVLYERSNATGSRASARIGARTAGSIPERIKALAMTAGPADRPDGTPNLGCVSSAIWCMATHSPFPSANTRRSWRGRAGRLGM